MDQFTFRVDLRFLDPFLSPEEQEKIAISKTTWIPGLNAGDNFVGRHGDVFSLTGASGIYLRDMVANQRVFGVVVISIPNVQDLEVDQDGDEINVSWTPDDLYKTEVEYRFDGGSWSLYVADPGVSTMSIEVDGSMFEVRLRFTNGDGGYSNDYTTASIEIEAEEEGDCEETYVLLPINQDQYWVDGACLYGEATASEDDVVLVPDESDQIGSINYKLALTPSIVQADFEIQASTESETLGGKVVYYLGSTTHNITGELGYAVVFDYAENTVGLYYGGLDTYPLEMEEFDLPTEEWSRISIRFDNGAIFVRVNDEFVIYSFDSDDEHPISVEGNENVGVGAITSDVSGEFKLRNLLIEDVSTEDVDAVTIFGLTEWDD
jgi:hypothetical protein